MTNPVTVERRLAPSAKIIAFIQGFEKCRLKAYMPTAMDRPTIGWGSTGPDIRMGDVWTQAKADGRFVRDLAKLSADVTRLLEGCPTTQGQFDAMLSFAYNLGSDIDDDTIAEGLGDSRLLRKHKAGDFTGAAAEFAKWNRQKGVVLAGLTRRRLEEAAIYKGLA